MTGEITARVFARQDAAIVPVATPPPRLSADGAVLIEGTVGVDVALPRGSAELYVVLGHSERLPEPDDLTRQLRDTDGASTDHWSAWKLDIHTD